MLVQGVRKICLQIKKNEKELKNVRKKIKNRGFRIRK